MAFPVPMIERLRKLFFPEYYPNALLWALSMAFIVLFVIVLSRQGKQLNGREPVPLYHPEWWGAFGAIEHGMAASTALLTVESTTKESLPSKALPLFATAEERPSAKGKRWVEALLNSPTFISQSKLAGRAAPTPDQVRQFLSVLDERNGRILKSVLAQKLEQPELHIEGLLAAMRRLLNVDGYGVLSVDETLGTVMLNRKLLEAQFELK